MALLDSNSDVLLQQIAIELAFVESDASSITAIGVALRALRDEKANRDSEPIQAEIERLLGWLDQQIPCPNGFDQNQTQALLEGFSRLEKSLYDGALGSKDPPQEVLGRASSEPVSTPSTEDQDRELDEEASLKICADDDLELLNEFCNEGRDLLTQIEQGLLILEKSPEHRETLNQVFRAFHTFKGGAAFLGLVPIKELAHILESLLDEARRGDLAIDRHMIELILAGGDTLRQFVDGIEEEMRSNFQKQLIRIPTRQLIARVEACLAGEPDPFTITEEPIPRKRDSEGSNPEDHQPKLTNLAAPPGATPLVGGGNRPNPPEGTLDGLPHFVKIDTRKLDSLVELVGELMIAQSMVVEHPGMVDLKGDQLARPLRDLARITSDLQRNAMSLRMVPIRSTFKKMNRLVRDLATSQGKQIQLVVSGEETELDRNIVEALAEPLIHLLRNAADHGIGGVEERLAAGKPPQGTIQLQAGYQGGGICIRIQDDGKGIDPEKIRQRAIQRELVPADFNGTTQDLLSLIFLPGFSTAETVTDLSGRGVGLDVVRGSITRLRGRVEITSMLGQGTSFTIHLPLTLAIIDGMLVAVDGQRFILPTLSIHESFRPQRSMLSTVKGTGQLVNVRGRLIPLLQLSRRLGLNQEALDPCEGIVVVIDTGGKLLGVLVDDLIGKQEVVIKGMGETFEQQPFFSGAAILGDGRVALILDPDALGRVDSHRGLATEAALNRA